MRFPGEGRSRLPPGPGYTRDEPFVFFVLIWPIGVVFILFSERVNDPLELITILAAGVVVFSAGGLVASLLVWRRRGDRPSLGS